MSGPHRSWRRVGRRFAAALCMASMLMCAGHAEAASPLAGTSIGNQASATYSDGSLVTHTVTSNTVTTVVQQVAGMTLTASSARTAAIGGLVSYPHTLTNTGNGADTFTLGVSNSGIFSLSSALVYADVNGDGVPDDNTPITSTGELASGAIFKFVVVGAVPSSAIAGATNTMTVTATSVFTPTVTASNTDSTTLSGNGVIQVTKAIDVNAGAAGSGPRTYTLTYTNVGNLTATAVTLMDTLPSGMSYVPGSGRWSVGGATVLTDASAADNQGGIVYDYGVSAPGRVTAVIASVAPGVTGTLRFQANVNVGLAAGASSSTLNTASFTYNDGVSVQSAVSTNGVQFVVSSSVGVTLSSATVASAPQGSTVTFTHVLSNTGNASDSFDMRMGTGNFPAGTTFAFFQPDGVTPLLDTNGNGVPDSGPLGAGGSVNIVVKAFLPPGARGGPYTAPLTATSRADATQVASASDTLSAIAANQVDVTLNTFGSGAPGFGPGPESTAALTNQAAAGSVSRFTVVLNNTSAVPDTFNLQASSDVSFAGITLPTGWTVVFKDASGALIANTGVINAGATLTVYADVLVPPTSAATTTDFYIRATSPTSGATDKLHAAVQIGTVRSLIITPNHEGQVYPGGAVVYPVAIVNAGNVTEGDGAASQVALALANTQSTFTTTLYWDKNNNGVLDAGDPVVTSLADLTGGTAGASTAAGLNAGETATLFVKVFAPTGAAVGVVNTSTLTATTTGVIQSVNPPAQAVESIATNVIAGKVQLLILQALDAACDGTADTAYSPNVISTGAIPGACIRYQITAANVGIANATSVVISNATPASTTYHATVPASVTQGTVTAPGAGSAGTVQATVGTLTPGQSATLSYGVRINP